MDNTVDGKPFLNVSGYFPAFMARWSVGIWGIKLSLASDREKGRAERQSCLTLCLHVVLLQTCLSAVEVPMYLVVIH